MKTISDIFALLTLNTSVVGLMVDRQNSKSTYFEGGKGRWFRTNTNGIIVSFYASSKCFAS